ncbi:hypothetical protein [Algoriphagus sp.]|jgi:hypothetical protein|uniref:hypothetical protein n=1 Tax=Algoriphagus sp. TaxID=1872435 RepID=UPI0027212CAA|nr:hypothetical protein [Algoriphagus sp.]MDO8967900.1 hypothetical protein [Algoriphagus sp.]MDP3201133.1 hypothetical protein [Algoriphagus sp.]
MFDIDIPTLVIASVFIAAVSAIFIYYSLKIKKERKEFQDKFNQFISGLNLKPEKKEDWRNRYIIGIDPQKQTLVYCDFGKSEEKIAISLPEVSKVVVHEVFRELEQSSTSRKVLENLFLKIQFKNPGKPALNLPIYSAEDFSDLLGETVLASNWAQIINQQLSK